MKSFWGILLITLLVTGCASSKKANEPEPVPAEHIDIPKTLNHNLTTAPEFCVTLNPSFTYLAYMMTIYKLSGERVWTTDDPNACWDGKVNTNGAASLAPQGAYAVIIEIEATNGKRYKTNSVLAVIH